MDRHLPRSCFQEPKGNNYLVGRLLKWSSRTWKVKEVIPPEWVLGVILMINKYLEHMLQAPRWKRANPTVKILFSLFEFLQSSPCSLRAFCLEINETCLYPFVLSLLEFEWLTNQPSSQTDLRSSRFWFDQDLCVDYSRIAGAMVIDCLLDSIDHGMIIWSHSDRSGFDHLEPWCIPDTLPIPWISRYP